MKNMKKAPVIHPDLRTAAEDIDLYVGIPAAKNEVRSAWGIWPTIRFAIKPVGTTMMPDYTITAILRMRGKAQTNC
jgi:hypothetical protein